MASFLLKVRLTEASDIRMRRKFFFLAFKAAEYERKELLENLKFESILDSILSRKTFSGKNVIGMVKRGKRKNRGRQ